MSETSGNNKFRSGQARSMAFREQVMLSGIIKRQEKLHLILLRIMIDPCLKQFQEGQFSVNYIVRNIGGEPSQKYWGC